MFYIRILKSETKSLKAFYPAMMMIFVVMTTMKTQPESEVGSWCAVLPEAIQESLAIHWYTHSLTGMAGALVYKTLQYMPWSLVRWDVHIYMQYMCTHCILSLNSLPYTDILIHHCVYSKHNYTYTIIQRYFGHGILPYKYHFLKISQLEQI